MPTVDLGKIKITWRGTYNATTTYEADDAVYFNGSSYIFTGPSPSAGAEPSVSSTSWDLMAQGQFQASTQGQIFYRGATSTELLNPGTDGHVLTTQGASENPIWASTPINSSFKVVKLPDTDRMMGGELSGGVILEDRSILIWGDGYNGNLGIGTVHSDLAYPVKVPFDPLNQSVAKSTVVKWRRFGKSSWCVMSDGSVWVWGSNSRGELGVGHSSTVDVPQEITSLSSKTIVDVGAGAGGHQGYYSAMLLASDGSLFGTGFNAYGQLGLGDLINRNVPTILTKNDWSSISVAGGARGRTFGIDTSGDLWSWGFSPFGELGLGNNTAQQLPQQITLEDRCIQVSSSDGDLDTAGEQFGGHTLALLENGKVFSWGRNDVGQLGQGNTTYRNSPTEITSLGTNNQEILAAGGRDGYSVVRKTDGTIRVFGNNNHGQLGVGGSTSSAPSNPTAIAGNGGIKKILCSGGKGYAFTAILFHNGICKVTGHNSVGNLGVGHNGAVTAFQNLPFYPLLIDDICLVGSNVNVALGILTEDGNYFQTGPGIAGQAGTGVDGGFNYSPKQVRF